MLRAGQFCFVRRLLILGLGDFILGSASPSLAGGVTFSDQTIPAGVNYLHWNGVQPPGVSFQAMLYQSAGAAAADYDNDGWCDLFVTRINQANLLYRNLGNGAFQEVGAAAGVNLVNLPGACVWGDVNNDGFLDLYVVTYHKDRRNYLYMNDGDGTFTEGAIARSVHCPDIHVPPRRHFSGAAFGDYDLDGDLDLYVTEWISNLSRNSLFQNDGTGFFTDVSGAAGVYAPTMYGFSPTFVDYDNDRWPDLLVASDFLTSRLFRNLGNGTFADLTATAQVGTDENGMGSSLGDYDNDGDFDWFITSIFDPNETCDNGGSCDWGYSGNRFYRNDGAGLFADVTDAAGVRDGRWGWGTSFLDYDNDGDLDLGMTNGLIYPFTGDENAFNADALRFWENNGAGVMTEIAAAVGMTDTQSGKGYLVFDYDNDGDTDVFIANTQGNPRLYRNDGGNAGDWIKLRFKGRSSNMFGVNNRIEVQATPVSPTQMREVFAGCNFQSQNEFTQLVGLGAGVSTVHVVRVLWPMTGLEQEFKNLASNQVYLIEECPKGDVNLSGVVQLDDMDPLIDLMLDGAPTGMMQAWTADVNNDETIDSLDIAPYVNCVLAIDCP